MRVIKAIVLRSKKLVYAVLSGLMLVLLSYELSDLPLFTGEDINTLSVMQWVKERITTTKVDDDLNDAVFVNTAHDKALADVYDNKRRIGNTDISDRSKLLQLLMRLDSVPYRYIIMDIRFEKGIASTVDSALFHQICSMRDIVVARHKDLMIADSILLPKSATADFNSTITSTNFSHYQYVTDEEVSMSAYAYRELTHNEVTKHPGYYLCHGQLCQKSVFLQFSTEKFDYLRPDGQLRYYNLGVDILDNQYLDFDNTMKDKVVVIGNLEEDTHDTYAGQKPGSLIVYRALTTLMNDGHIVKLWYLFFQFVLYTLIAYTLFSRTSLLERIPLLKCLDVPLMRLLVSFVGYSTVLMIASIVLFIVFDKVLSIFWISLLFSVIKNIVTYKTKKP